MQKMSRRYEWAKQLIATGPELEANRTESVRFASPAAISRICRKHAAHVLAPDKLTRREAA
jgi:hypothetical protein